MDGRTLRLRAGPEKEERRVALESRPAPGDDPFAYLAARREESAARRAATTPNAAPKQGTFPQQGSHVAKQRNSALGAADWTYRNRTDQQ